MRAAVRAIRATRWRSCNKTTRVLRRAFSDGVPRSPSGGAGASFADNDQGASEEHRRSLAREQSILEQHAQDQLDAMFKLEAATTERNPADSAARASVGVAASLGGDACSEAANFEQLRRQQRGGPMSEQRRKAWQRFPDVHAGNAIVPRPRRIVLIRHAESLGNVDEVVHTTTPDWKIPLTDRGRSQAADMGDTLRELIGDSSIYIYHSPYVRTAETCQQILSRLPAAQVKGVREEPRISEQQFGNLHDLDSIRRSKVERKLYGRFFYRFKNGEAGLDVYSRISSFIGTLRRDHLDEDATIIIITHGLALRLFLMRFFQWTVEQFEATHNPPNCGLAIMKRLPDGRYRLTSSSLEMLGADQAPRMSSIGRNIFRRAFVDTFLSY